MTTKTTVTTAAAIGIVSALAVPAVAAAHPAVYTQTAQVNRGTAAQPDFRPQDRYVVANHGWTFVLRETNGRPAGQDDLARGVITYAKAAGRAKTAGFLDTDAARTGAQAHATCEIPTGSPRTLSDETTIRSWQGATAEDKGEPFYAYVPFQTGSAGLDDVPATWLPVVQARTGIDLTAIPDTDDARKAACESPAVGGTYYKADEIQSSNASFNSSLVARTRTETAAPFEARLRTFQEQLDEARAKQAAAEKALADAKAAPTPATAPVQPKPLAASLERAALTPAGVVSDGVPVAITGPAGQRVRVRATVTSAAARRHRLRSTVLGSKGGVVGRDGTARIVVKPSRAQGAALKAARGALSVTLELVVATTKATVSR